MQNSIVMHFLRIFILHQLLTMKYVEWFLEEKPG